MLDGRVRERVATVVVRSGSGGSVTNHLTEAGQRVVLLERGKTAYEPGRSPREPRAMERNFWDLSEGRHGVSDVWSFRGPEAMVASGLGGGSLIYADVLLRKDERGFVQEDPRRDGHESVPGQAPPEAPHGSPHGRARRTSHLSGKCDIGCNIGGNNPLDDIQLSATLRSGADVRTGCQVRALAPHRGDGWMVHNVEHLPGHEGRPGDTRALPLRQIHAELGFVLDARRDGVPTGLGRSAVPDVTRAIRVPMCVGRRHVTSVCDATRTNGGHDR